MTLRLLPMLTLILIAGCTDYEPQSSGEMPTLSTNAETSPAKVKTLEYHFTRAENQADIALEVGATINNRDYIRFSIKAGQTGAIDDYLPCKDGDKVYATARDAQGDDVGYGFATPTCDGRIPLRVTVIDEPADDDSPYSIQITA